jgi:O-acetyl-ADP-ribose deacetylase (regulator of RNase III)
MKMVILMDSSIEVRKIDITELEVDVIVNAANTGLREVGGVCGAIFQKAGSSELAEACHEIVDVKQATQQ